MAFKFRCSSCGKRLTVNEAPGSEVTCPHCNQATPVPADAQPTETEAAGADMAPAVAPPADVPAGAAAAAGAPPEGEEEEEQPQTGVDTVMGWLALYLPSWGTSLVFHVAIGFLLAFMSWQVQAEVPTFEYKSAPVQVEKPKTEKRLKPNEKPNTGRGKLRPGPTSIVRQYTQNPFPDVASNKMKQLAVIGVGGGGNEIGGFEGLGTGRGFFGTGAPETARKIVYVVDRSGSMTDSIDYVKYELKRSIGELGEENEFHVIFYSSGPPVEMPTRRLVAATDRNKSMAFEFIDSVIPQGETDPSKALERAFTCGPDLIYLLTDGEFDKAIVDIVKRLNAGGKVTVHTIGFYPYDRDPNVPFPGEEVLKRIANDNQGNYKLVTKEDLQAPAN